MEALNSRCIVPENNIRRTKMDTNSGPTKRINQRAVVELTRTLVERPSENPPGEEASVASAIVELLENSSVGFDVEVTDVHPDRPNIVARAGNPEMVVSY